MLWKIFGVFVLLFGSLSAADVDLDKSLSSIESPLFVSLGSHCEPAVQLRENQLRKVAFPFDWMETINHEGFLKILDEDFSFFLDKRYFI